MNTIDLLDDARALQDFCDKCGWLSCFIGGIAVQRWGQPRVTRDVDLILLTGFGHEAPFIGALLAEYAPRYSNAAEFALRSRVLLLNSPNGVGTSPLARCLSSISWCSMPLRSSSRRLSTFAPVPPRT